MYTVTYWVLSVNTASFCAGTQAPAPQVPEHQVQTALRMSATQASFM